MHLLLYAEAGRRVPLSAGVGRDGENTSEPREIDDDPAMGVESERQSG